MQALHAALAWLARNWLVLVPIALIVVHDLWPNSKAESVLRDVSGAVLKLGRRALSVGPTNVGTKPIVPVVTPAARTVILLNHLSQGARPDITPAWLTLVCAALNVQLAQFAAAYGLQPWTVQPYTTGSVESPIVAIFGKSDVPGALGYHDVGPNGLPYGDVFADGESLDELSETISHELLELVGDLWADRWRVDADSGVGYAEEACDAVQGSPYRIGNVRVANFVLPSWYNARAKAKKVDYRGILSVPLSRTSEGYLIEMTGGVVSTVPAMSTMTPRMAARKLRPNARTKKRLEAGLIVEDSGERVVTLPKGFNS